MSRKLPRWVRKINLGYKIAMCTLSAANLVLSLLNGYDDITIPNQYFEILSVLLGIAPVIWNGWLDSLKEYHNDLTSTTTTPLTPLSQNDSLVPQLTEPPVERCQEPPPEMVSQ